MSHQVLLKVYALDSSKSAGDVSQDDSKLYDNKLYDNKLYDSR